MFTSVPALSKRTCRAADCNVAGSGNGTVTKDTKSHEGNAHKLQAFVILRALCGFMPFSFIVKLSHYPWVWRPGQMQTRRRSLFSPDAPPALTIKANGFASPTRQGRFASR